MIHFKGNGHPDAPEFVTVVATIVIRDEDGPLLKEKIEEFVETAEFDCEMSLDVRDATEDEIDQFLSPDDSDYEDDADFDDEEIEDDEVS